MKTPRSPSNRLSLFTLSLAAIVLVGCDQSLQSYDVETVRGSFSNQLVGDGCKDPINATCPPIHEAITVDALAFLRPEVKNFLAVQNAIFDASNNLVLLNTAPSQNTAYAHFDNCTFQGSSQLIADNETLALARAMDDVSSFSCPTATISTCGVPSTGAVPLAAFAAALHTVQDFYSHTNWVETGVAALVDESLSVFPVLSPYTSVPSAPGLIVVDQTKPGWSIQPATVTPDIYPNHVLPRAVFRHSSFQALMSGVTSSGFPIHHVVAATFPDDCPPVTGRGGSYLITHDELAKDGPTTHPQNFGDAYAFAVLQSRHEWCRFMNLVNINYGDAGTKHVCDQWVADPASMNAACPTLPPEAQCCPSGTSRCGSQCANLQTDANNCGGCGNSCPGSDTCVAGACTAPVGCAFGSCCTMETPLQWTCPTTGCCQGGYYCSLPGCVCDVVAPEVDVCTDSSGNRGLYEWVPDPYPIWQGTLTYQ